MTAAETEETTITAETRTMSNCFFENRFLRSLKALFDFPAVEENAPVRTFEAVLEEEREKRPYSLLRFLELRIAPERAMMATYANTLGNEFGVESAIEYPPIGVWLTVIVA